MKFHPKNIFNISDIKKSVLKYGLVVLNRPILLHKELVKVLWNHSSINITVDGGTNRWLSWIIENELEEKMKPPCFITGDMDSCHSETLKYFNKTKVISTPDQDATDFTKALNVLDSFVNKLELSHIVVICETSGRFDQIIANINTLFENNQKPKEIVRPVYILTSNSVTWLLPPTSINSMHEIHIPINVKNQWCSLIPIANSAIVTTSGLKWNLDHNKMEFGGIVSTSNKYDDQLDVVKIATDSILIWSMGVQNED
ncbi:unnamed protein product [Chironomus riparius]|uniref:Thiamin pyrophosphokinase thiamin-binding domain-containing protein n=1 Tax=Chironomus riparius TaxID=315576 RepID=A0A9N9S740_9DIPT|nr:unnamed protein product [Chironomus riparius]